MGLGILGGYDFEPPEWAEEESTPNDFPEELIENRSLQDVEEIDTGDYPEAAQENARMALEAREETGNPNDCGTRVGWERANQLDNGEDLSEDTISRMAAFERHEDNKDQGEEGKADCGWLMWKAWGGDEGIEWAQDKLDEFDQARENAGGSGNSTERYEWEQAFSELREQVYHGDSDQKLLSFAGSAIPGFVKDQLRSAVLSVGVFGDIDGASSEDQRDMEQYLIDELESGNWTVDGVAGRLEDIEPNLDNPEAVARTELGNIMKTGREMGYEEEGLADDGKFYWTGNTGDGRTTDTCKYLVEGTGNLENSGAFSDLKRPDGTNPFEGGEPIEGLDNLKEHVHAVAEADPAFDTNPRGWTPHINCRKNYARHVE